MHRTSNPTWTHLFSGRSNSVEIHGTSLQLVKLAVNETSSCRKSNGNSTTFFFSFNRRKGTLNFVTGCSCISNQIVNKRSGEKTKYNSLMLIKPTKMSKQQRNFSIQHFRVLPGQIVSTFLFEENWYKKNTRNRYKLIQSQRAVTLSSFNTWPKQDFKHHIS